MNKYFFLLIGCIVLAQNSINAMNKQDEAAKGGNMEQVISLIDSSNVNLKDKWGRSPLYWAAQNDRLEAVRYLLDLGASINQQDLKGNTALHRAACFGHPTIVQILLDRGANIDLQNNKGRTALHEAASIGCHKHGKHGSSLRKRNAVPYGPEVLKILLAHNANTALPDKKGHFANPPGNVKIDRKLSIKITRR